MFRYGSSLSMIALFAVVASGTEECVNSPGNWHEDGFPQYDCVWYEQGQRCSRYGGYYDGSDGKTANQACCACGGGSYVSSRGRKSKFRGSATVPAPVNPVQHPAPSVGSQPSWPTWSSWSIPTAPEPSPSSWSVFYSHEEIAPAPTFPSWPAIAWAPVPQPPPAWQPTAPTNIVWAPIAWAPTSPWQAPTLVPPPVPIPSPVPPPVAPIPLHVSPPVTAAPPAPILGPSLPTEAQQWLDAHNVRRQSFHTSNGVSYVPLQWSESLANSAKGYTQLLLNGFSTCHIEHNFMGDSYGGENLALITVATMTPNAVLSWWFEQEEFLPYPQNGHRTQVAWRATQYVGCSIGTKVMSDGKLCSIATCRYIAPGNCNGPGDILQSTTPCTPQCPIEGCR